MDGTSSVYPRDHARKYDISRQQFKKLDQLPAYQAKLKSHLQTHAQIEAGHPPTPGTTLASICIENAHHKLSYDQVEKLLSNPRVKGEEADRLQEELNEQNRNSMQPADIVNCNAWVDGETIDAYVEMCGRYINLIRERHRLGHERPLESQAQGEDETTTGAETMDAEPHRHVITIPYRDFHEVVRAGERHNPENRYIVGRFEKGGISFSEIGNALRNFRDLASLGEGVELNHDNIRMRYMEHAPWFFEKKGIPYTPPGYNRREAGDVGQYQDDWLNGVVRNLGEIETIPWTHLDSVAVEKEILQEMYIPREEWKYGKSSMKSLLHSYQLKDAEKLKQETDYIIIPWWNRVNDQGGHIFLMGLAPKQGFAFLIDSITSVHTGDDSPSRYLWMLHAIIFGNDYMVKDGDLHIYRHWAEKPEEVPEEPHAARQGGKYNCGIFAATNAWCLGAGFNLRCYSQSDLDVLKRWRMCAELDAGDLEATGFKYDLLEVPKNEKQLVGKLDETKAKNGQLIVEDLDTDDGENVEGAGDEGGDEEEDEEEAAEDNEVEEGEEDKEGRESSSSDEDVEPARKRRRVHLTLRGGGSVTGDSRDSEVDSSEESGLPTPISPEVQRFPRHRREAEAASPTLEVPHRREPSQFQGGHCVEEVFFFRPRPDLVAKFAGMGRNELSEWCKQGSVLIRDWNIWQNFDVEIFRMWITNCIMATERQEEIKRGRDLVAPWKGLVIQCNLGVVAGH